MSDFLDARQNGLQPEQNVSRPRAVFAEGAFRPAGHQQLYPTFDRPQHYGRRFHRRIGIQFGISSTVAAHLLELRGWPRSRRQPAVDKSYMDCQICLRQLEALEPVYRMQFGPAINGGSRMSVCEKCLYAFLKTSKYWTLRDRFRPSEPCAACGRPVYNLKAWKVTHVFCSSACRSVTGSGRRKGLRTSQISRM